jgi:hypothetical protein
LNVIKDFEFSKNGGPVIALQLENEYDVVKNENDLEYLTFLKDTVEKSGFKELLFTCDGPTSAKHFLNGIKANFDNILFYIQIEVRLIPVIYSLISCDHSWSFVKFQ